MYRPNVVGIFKDKDGRLLVGKRTDMSNTVWQFPQGGVDAQEDIKDAIKREMWEELGLRDFKMIKQANEQVTYLFPPDMKLSKEKMNFIGQSQTWFLLELVEHSQPNLQIAPDQEFCELNWMWPWEIIEQAVFWKKEAYIKGLKLLGINTEKD